MVQKQLIEFGEYNLEILIKSDVGFEFDGEILMSGKQVASILNYSNDRKAILDHVDPECKLLLKNSDVLNRDFRKLNNAGETFLTEDGVFDLIYNSKLPKAKDFKKQVRKIIKTIQKIGRFDLVEDNLMTITDEKEKQLRLTIAELERLVKINSENLLAVINLNQTKSELEIYMQQKHINSLSKTVSNINQKITDIKDIISINPKAEWRSQINVLIAKICVKTLDYAKTKSKLYTSLEKKAGCNLDIRLKNLKKKAEKTNLAPNKIQKLNYLDVLENDKKLRSIFIELVKRQAIILGVTLSDKQIALSEEQIKLSI